jgi:molybdate transport system substrate-binding protein
VALGCWLLSGAALAANGVQPIRVFAAASLVDVLQEIGNTYTSATGTKIEFSFAASSTLARQVENGAQADVFCSADQQWMDYLQQRGLIQPATRHDLAGNRLALVAPADSDLRLQIQPGFSLRAALKDGRLATGDPQSVPVGRYARAALTSLGVWLEVEDRLVLADDARQALVFVASGEAPLGIVYETDARAEKRVRIVGLFPVDSHPPITYPVALTATAQVRAADFVAFLGGPVGMAAFRKYGFSVPGSAVSN